MGQGMFRGKPGKVTAFEMKIKNISNKTIEQEE